jgi:hypothetical protein
VAGRSQTQRKQYEKVKLELEQVEGNLKLTKLQEEKLTLEIANLRKPWWKKEPIATITVSLALLSALLGFRGPKTDLPRPTDPTPYYENEERNRRAPQLWPPTDPSPNRLLDKWAQFRRETEEERWQRLYSSAPEFIKVKIHDVFELSRHVFGESGDAEIVRLGVQSILEKGQRVDPLWLPTFSAPTTKMPPRINP